MQSNWSCRFQMELGREQGAVRGERDEGDEGGQLLLPQEVRQERVQDPVQRRAAAQRRTPVLPQPVFTQKCWLRSN